MDFDNPEVYGDTFICDGLVFAEISSFKAVQGSTVPVSGQTVRIILYKRDGKNSIERLFARVVK